MIHQVTASDPRFKTLVFGPGLNILLANQHDMATDTDTRNGVGKSSLMLLLHFLLGGNAGPSSIFRSHALASWTFSLDFELGKNRVTVSRSGSDPSTFKLTSGQVQEGQLPMDGTVEQFNLRDWNAVLGQTWFGLSDESGPSIRSILSYFIRRVDSGGFHDPFKHSYQQTIADYQAAVSFLLDLDWRFARRWDDVRKHEKTVSNLSRAFKEGRLGPYSVGSVAKLRTELTLAEEHVETLKSSVSEFRVIDSFFDLEREANQISATIRQLSDESTMDHALIEQILSTYESETPPNPDAVSAMYEAAGVQLGDLIRRRFSEVEEFHESIITNRARHLREELSNAQARISERQAEQRRLDLRRAEILQTLQSGGALSQLTGLQGELARAEVRLEELRSSYKIADQLATGKAGAKRARQELLVELQQDQRERDSQLRGLIRRFEEFSSHLYDERVGSLQIGASEKGPTFSIEIDAGKSKGIGNMQIFCFDLLIAEICARRGIGPGFLVHDSHIFDGVDERQIGRGLALADEISTLNGFQYIVTMNSDAMPSTLPGDFDPRSHILSTELTDAVEDGGLFGFRF